MNHPEEHDEAIDLAAARQGLEIDLALAQLRAHSTEFFLLGPGRSRPQLARIETPSVVRVPVDWLEESSVLSHQSIPVVNPNAGVVPAFPKGRWT